VIDDTADFSSPVIDYVSGLNNQTSRSYSVGQAAETGQYLVGYEGQVLKSGTYYWKVMSINSNNLNSNWAVANSGSPAFSVVSPPVSNIRFKKFISF
jgi:hypothetical protein